jgi:5-methylcytosine-specific restriction protein A
MTYKDAYRRDDPDRRFLQCREWREHIRPRQLEREPLCRFCLALGRKVRADHIDHIKRPRGDYRLQRDPANFQSLCSSHHAQKSRWERGDMRRQLCIGVQVDGWLVFADEGGTIEIPR